MGIFEFKTDNNDIITVELSRLEFDIYAILRDYTGEAVSCPPFDYVLEEYERKNKNVRNSATLSRVLYETTYEKLWGEGIIRSENNRVKVLHNVFSPPGIVFVGKGFYKTDHPRPEKSDDNIKQQKKP